MKQIVEAWYIVSLGYVQTIQSAGSRGGAQGARSPSYF